jgi:hypothetical protein
MTLSEHSRSDSPTQLVAAVRGSASIRDEMLQPLFPAHLGRHADLRRK